MLITHVLNATKAQKSQTPKRKIKQIATSKNHLNINRMNNCNSKQLSANKQNYNPNIKKSPSQEKECVNQGTFKGKQIRVKSQYYNSSNTSLNKQSPIKKILFVKNLCYKSTKTSKNSSLEKRQQTQKYLSLNNYGQRYNVKMQNKQDLKSERQDFQSKDHQGKNSAQSQSEIFQENKTNQKHFKQLKAKGKIAYQNQSQANYRLSIAANQVRSKLSPLNESSSIKHNFQGINSFDSNPPHGSQVFYSKYSRMCPNIQNPVLSQLEAFKHKNHIFPTKIQTKPLISLDRQNKQTQPSKQRSQEAKLAVKESHRNAQLPIGNKVQSHQGQIVSQMGNQIQINNLEANAMYLREMSDIQKLLEGTDRKMYQGESTQIQNRSKDFQETLETLHCQFSHSNLNESKDRNCINNVWKQPRQIYCDVHPQKQAKFKVSKEGSTPFYCSKCTVSLVTQGYKVLQKLQQKSSRLQKLKNFICKIDTLQPKLKKFQQTLKDLQAQAHQLEKKGQQQIASYYKQLIETLQKHRENALDGLEFHFKGVFSYIYTLKKSITFNQDEVKFMKSDILPNIDLIVNQSRLPQNSFKQIICQHQNKLTTLQQLVQKVNQVVEGKQNKIVFKTVEIPVSQTKLAINALERTQIVFVDKVLKLITKLHPNDTQIDQNQVLYKQSSKEIQNTYINQMKKSFSFDEQNIDASFYLPSSKKKCRNTNLPTLNECFELGDSIRLSFGNKFQINHSLTLKSPTFKAI